MIKLTRLYVCAEPHQILRAHFSGGRQLERCFDVSHFATDPDRVEATFLDVSHLLSNLSSVEGSSWSITDHRSFPVFVSDLSWIRFPSPGYSYSRKLSWFRLLATITQDDDRWSITTASDGELSIFDSASALIRDLQPLTLAEALIEIDHEIATSTGHIASYYEAQRQFVVSV